jgi:hypothetical protein
MNIWPRAVEAVASGKVDASTAAIVVLQSVAVATMAAVPFAFEKSRNWLLKLFCLAFGAALFSVNLFNAIEVTGHVRETITAGSSGALAKAAALDSRLAGLRKSRNEVPQHAFTSPAGLSAAQSAVTSAQAARDAECKYVGTVCRERETQLAAAQRELARIAGERELTERADRIDADIRAAEKERADLGLLPAHADPTAAKIAAIFGNGLTETSVHENWPTWLAIVVELLALLGPVTWVEALRTPHHAESAPAQQSKAVAIVEPASLPQIPLTAVPELTAVSPSPATPALIEKPKKIKHKDIAGVGSVRDWFNSRTTARAGHLVRVNECYSAYVEWCKAAGLEAASLTKFGTVMKGELGVEYIEKSKRGYYVGIGLKGAALQLAVVNS